MAKTVWLDAVDSTNEEARRRTLAGAPGRLWIAARTQTGGRGRRGRVWAAVPGNLYATLLIRPSPPPALAALHSFAACLAVADLFEAAGAEVRLKWPNDALIGDGKAAGVLLESGGAGGRPDWLAIGVGVNLVGSPPAEPGAHHPPTNLLAETGVRIAAEDALKTLAAALDGWGERLRAGGFAPLRAAWLARAVKLGERIEARLPDETCEGVFEDMDETGALILSTPAGRRRIRAADIYFR